jgi:Zn-dependent protease with chaperone function
MTQAEERLEQEPPAPILVYNRIDANRRNTRLLLGAFAALLVPFEYCAVVAAPFVFDFTMRLLVLFLSEGQATFPSRYQQAAGSELISLTIVLLALISAIGFAYAGDAFISSFLLWRAEARRAHRNKEPDLFRTVENLCIGAGLPPPTLYIVESTEPNAFATGCDPEHASLVVSRGLLHLLDERELGAVVAHELSHIGNHDTDFSTMLAALVATVRLPLRVVMTGLLRPLMVWLNGVTRARRPCRRRRGAADARPGGVGARSGKNLPRDTLQPRCGCGDRTSVFCRPASACVMVGHLSVAPADRRKDRTPGENGRWDSCGRTSGCGGGRREVPAQPATRRGRASADAAFGGGGNCP